ncbi:MAG: hypothetical protein U0230_03405 [Polyangiales bacterium]
MNDRQVEAIVRRAEGQLRGGQASAALRTIQPATRALVWGYEYISPAGLIPLYNRALALGCTAVVRIGGARTYANQASTDRHATLVDAERCLRDLRREGNPVWDARHGEALVALGDRMPEAYALLAELHARGAIREPEAYAALVLAARATSHPDVAAQASERCLGLARSRARRVCPR